MVKMSPRCLHLLVLIALGAFLILSQQTSAQDEGDWETTLNDTALSFTISFRDTDFQVDTLTNITDLAFFSSDVTITSNRNGWIGLMIGTTMEGGTALIGLDVNDPGNAALGLPGVGLYSLPTKSLDVTKSCVPIIGGLEQNGISNTSFSVIDGRSQMKFTITRSVEGPFQLLGALPGTPVVVAFVSGAAAKLDYHTNQFYSFNNVPFSATPGGGGQIPVQPALIKATPALAAHVVLIIVAWLFLLPAGASCAIGRRSNNSAWFKYHRLLQVLGVLIGYGGVIAGVQHVEELGLHFSRGHHAIGYVIGTLSLVQLVLGFMRPHAPEPGEDPTRPRRRWYGWHRWLGAFLLLAGILNCIIGALVLPEVVGGEQNIVDFFGTAEGIAAKDMFIVVVALSSFSSLMLIYAGCRGRRRRNNPNSDDAAYPQKPQNNKMDDFNKAPPSSFIQPPPRNNFNNNNNFGGGASAFPEPPPRSNFNNNNNFGGGGGSNMYNNGGGGGASYSPYNESPAPRLQFGAVPPPNAGFEQPSSYGQSKPGNSYPSAPPRSFSPPPTMMNPMGGPGNSVPKPYNPQPSIPAVPPRNMNMMGGGGGGGYPAPPSSFNANFGGGGGNGSFNNPGNNPGNTGRSMWSIGDQASSMMNRVSQAITNSRYPSFPRFQPFSKQYNNNNNGGGGY